MRKDGLISIEFFPGIAVAILVYEPGADYVLGDIIDYVLDISDGRSTGILIYEGASVRHELVRTDEKTWDDICTAPLT
jgi:hypothetical protein